ncbi:MAG: hypothetical protein ABI165_19940, partial [Bryobacteraceae bacterium]
MNYRTNWSAAGAVAGLAGLMLGCAVGPRYSRPSAGVPSAYKESPPPSFKEMKNWKAGQPIDGALRGKWW